MRRSFSVATLSLFLVFFLVLSASGETAKKSKAPSIRPAELHEQRTAGKGPLVIDVRTPEEYASGHIPGAVNMDWLMAMDRGRNFRFLPEADLRALLKQVAGLDAELVPAHYAPISKRDTLVRLLNNIKIRALADGDAARGGEIIDRMIMIAPDAAFLLFEVGACHAKTGNLIRAAKALEAFLASGPDAKGRDEAVALLRQVRQQLN